jgi:hypothetical protein
MEVFGHEIQVIGESDVSQLVSKNCRSCLAWKAVLASDVEKAHAQEAL